MRLEHIYHARNRLAHHEPVLHKRFDEAVQPIGFVAENLGMTSPSADSPLKTLIVGDLEAVRRRADQLHGRLDEYRQSRP